MSLLSRLDKTLTLQRLTPAKDAAGFNAPTATNVLTGIPCSVAPASSSTRRDFAKDDIVVEHEVYTAQDIAPRVTDQLIIAGKTYTVFGYKPFENPSFGPSVYVTVCGRRNQP